MPGIILPNCYVSASRARYNANLKQTGKPQPNINRVRGSISPMIGTDYMMLTGAPEPALKVDHMIIVSADTDIVTGDIITEILDLDGVTPWIGAGPISDPSSPYYKNVVWHVRHHRVQAPRILPYRILFVEQVIIGGTASATA